MRKLTEQQRADRLAKLAALQALGAEIRAEKTAALLAKRDARATRAKRSRGFVILPMLALLALGAAAVYAGHNAEIRQREALALRCAINSDGADSSIADCYTSRDLPTPSDI